MNRLALREGWSTFILTSLVVFVAVWSIRQADWADGLGILTRVMLYGLFAGLIVAKQRRIPGWIAHALALCGGVVVVLYQMTVYLDDRLGNRREKLGWLADRAGRWVDQIVGGKQSDDLYLFVFFVSVVTLLLAYGSVWFVFRARWIWPALVFPGLLLFINLGYSHRVPTGLVVFYLFFALLLLVRFRMLERETSWRRQRIDYPSSIGWHAMWAATYLAMFILIFGWAFPGSVQSGRLHDAWLTVDGPWRAVEQRFNSWFTGLRGPGGGGIGGFASFSDSFELGGPLRLSDSPVVLVTGERSAPYLAAHRYAYYTGRGWESDVTQGRDENGQIKEVLPQVELRAGEAVDVGDEALDTRDRNDYTIRVERPRGALVFSPETFLSSDVGVNLVVPWTTVDRASVDLAGDVATAVPRELQRLVQLLQAYDFTPPDLVEPTPSPTADGDVSPTATPSPTSTPTEVVAPRFRQESDDIAAERQALAERGITFEYTIDPEVYRAATLTYSGAFPDIADVEAVYAREGLAAGETYEVSALETDAKSEELRQSSNADVPPEISARYLQLPDTVTDRTRALAAEVTQAAQTPYDRAKAIESFLRNTIEYTEDVEFPPSDRDVVDFVLFDTRKGYCEYYASAFIVMARSVNLPTRMVTGFFPADRDDDAGGFLYRERNAHAWPEVYLEGFGWVPFEPTAARSAFNREPAASANPATGAIDRESGGVGGPLPDDSEFLRDQNDLPTGSGVGAIDQQEPVTRLEWAIRAAIAMLMLGTLVLAFFWLRGLRGLSPTGQLYAKAVRGAGWGGITVEPSMTPQEMASTVANEVPGSRGPATYLADLYVRETYSGRSVPQTDLLRGRQAWLRLRGLLVKHFFSRLAPWKSKRDDDLEDDAAW